MPLKGCQGRHEKNLSSTRRLDERELFSIMPYEIKILDEIQIQLWGTERRVKRDVQNQEGIWIGKQKRSFTMRRCWIPHPETHQNVVEAVT
jgi:hypothetical protein